MDHAWVASVLRLGGRYLNSSSSKLHAQLDYYYYCINCNPERSHVPQENIIVIILFIVIVIIILRSRNNLLGIENMLVKQKELVSEKYASSWTLVFLLLLSFLLLLLYFYPEVLYSPPGT